MVKLSEMYRVIGNYLEIHGDKDVTSISSHCGSEFEYSLNLHDIHTGSIGTNPYTGEDKISFRRQ